MTLRSRLWVIDLVAKHKSGELRCPATALIAVWVKFMCQEEVSLLGIWNIFHRKQKLNHVVH